MNQIVGNEDLSYMNNELKLRIIADENKTQFKFIGTKKEVLDYLINFNAEILNKIPNIEERDMIIYANNIMLKGTIALMEKRNYEYRFKRN